MLVLGRKIGESFVLEVNGVEVTVKVMAGSPGRGGNQIRLAIDAPRSVRVMRAELRDRS